MALTVAVTGPTGEIGLPLMAELEGDPAVGAVRGMARRPFDPAVEGWEKASYRRGDILDRGSLAALFDGADVAVHLAFAIFGDPRKLAGSTSRAAATSSKSRSRRGSSASSTPPRSPPTASTRRTPSR
jgi:nucleoside-diphosphate-sugar epimerase